MKAVFVGLALASALFGQNPPPQQPQEGGPSLEETMKFLHDKLPGKLYWVIYGHDNIQNTDSVVKRSVEVSNVNADASRCMVGFHQHFERGNGMSALDSDVEIHMKQVEEISVKQMDDIVHEANAKAGHPERTPKTDPPISVVVLTYGDKPTMEFAFYDENMAERVLTAFQHAVNLCGGGNKEPF